MVNFVNEFALGIIAFSIGSEFRIKDLKKLGKDVFVITVFEVVGVLLAVFSVMYFLLDRSFVFSVVIASMSAATAPAGTMMVIRQFRAYGPLTKTILPVAALDDVLGIITFGIAMSLAKFSIGEAKASVPMMILAPIIEITLSFLLGLALGLVFTFLIKMVKSKEDALSAIITVILISTGLANYFKLSPLLVNMMVGAVLVSYHHYSKIVFDNINDSAPLINRLFFTFAGAKLDLSVLFSIGSLGIFYALARAIGKISDASFGAKLVGAKDTVVKYLGLALLCQGGISIGLSMIVARELPGIANEINTVILFSVLVFEILGPIFAKVAVSRAGEVDGLPKKNQKEIN